MSTEDKQKILLCGDVEGKFNALFKRVNSIIKKSGQEFEEYKTGIKKVPLPTYVLGPNKDDHLALYPQEDEELCPNVFYLGKRGIFTNSKGLRIAYISGIGSLDSREAYNYNGSDITELFDLCVRGNPAFRGVDILLSSQWPTNIRNNLDKNATQPMNSSELTSWLIMKLKPRYVVSGLEGSYYERPPFRIPSLGDHDSTLEISCRFIGLARVDNPNKEKWIYALSLKPLDKMKISELIQKTTDETGCPFSFDDLQCSIFKTKKKEVGMKQYFYDTSSPIDEPKSKKQKRAKIEFDQEKCWFCLASPSVEKHLIITVADHSYMALAKGGVVEEHFLICPIQHYQNSLNQPEPVKLEIDQFKRALYKFFDREGKVPVFFERNYKTSHMQLQVVPISKQATRELKEIFMEEAEAHSLNLDVLESHDRLDQVIPPNVPYFLVELPNGSILYTKIKGSFPINFGREVLCTGPILNLPERIEWKECSLSRDEEERLVQRIRTDFEPYDFSV
ncbi:hypothetical protein HHI36_000104 [Cryptolaemus montrouzieri]|uniref:CWF19-like protein 1 n=1 Tax=Cryptolaemus montrouzieri TaxID=559131 RepID=A0ABD2P3L4_9CUCU